VSNPSTAGEILWTLTDHLGTVRDLAVYDQRTEENTVANHRVYESFDRLTSKTNVAANCIFGYTGKLFDVATGLQNSQRRWYDAAVGRWGQPCLQPDIQRLPHSTAGQASSDPRRSADSAVPGPEARAAE